MIEGLLRRPLRLLLLHAPWPLGLGAVDYVEGCALATGVPATFWASHADACVSLIDGKASRIQRGGVSLVALMAGCRLLYVTLDCMTRASSRLFRPAEWNGPSATTPRADVGVQEGA